MSTRKRLTAQITHHKHAQGAMPPTWYNRPTPGLCRPAPFPHTVVETRCREQGGGYHETFIGSARAEMKVDYSETSVCVCVCVCVWVAQLGKVWLVLMVIASAVVSGIENYLGGAVFSSYKFHIVCAS